MTALEQAKLSTDQLATFLGVTVPRLNAWRHAGLLPHISAGTGYPAEYHLVEILSAWICGEMVRIGVKVADAAQAANHQDLLLPIAHHNVEDRVAKVMFRNGRPASSHDPLSDPKLVIPLEPVFQRLIQVLRAEYATHRGEEAAEAAEADFWRKIAKARTHSRYQEIMNAAILKSITDA